MAGSRSNTKGAKVPAAVVTGAALPGGNSPKGPLGLAGPRGKLLTGQIQGVNKEVSRLIYGTLFLHTLPTEEDVHSLLDSVWATGCNAFDCAAIYGGGLCEERMGRWIRSRQLCEGPSREELVLITKGGCEGQVRRRAYPWAARGTAPGLSALIALMAVSTY